MPGANTRIWLRSVLGVALILGVPGILVYALRAAYQSSPEPGTIDRGVFEYEDPAKNKKPAAPAESPAAPTVAPAPVPAAATGPTRVYECQRNGVRIYSSQPCGSDSVARDINTHAVNTKPLNEDACSDAQQEIDQIKARMGQPYSQAEGQFFRERLAKLGSRLRELKCGP